jgi:hypothetical protein
LQLQHIHPQRGILPLDMFCMATRSCAAGDSIGGFAIGVVLRARRAAAGSRIASNLADLVLKLETTILSSLWADFGTHLASIARLPSTRGRRKLLPRTADLPNILKQSPRRFMNRHRRPFKVVAWAFVRRWHVPRVSLTSKPCSEMVSSAVNAVSACRTAVLH